MPETNKINKLKIILQSAFFVLPILGLLALYFMDDPYKVLYTYNKYTDYYTQDAPQYGVNREYVSTEIFLKYFSQRNYDSFIFGSSRSLPFRCSDWEKYVKGSCFHFDASAETLFGIWGKFKLLNKLNVKINNCIIILDPFMLSFTTNSYSHLQMKHPMISGESPLKFQYIFASTFMSNKFFMPYIVSKSGFYVPDWLEFPAFMVRRGFHYDTLSNDINFSSVDAQLKTDEAGFYKEYGKQFYYRDSTRRIYMDPVIQERQKQMLRDISVVLRSGNTNYKILIYPNYNEKYLNPEDLKVLNDIFGNETIYNYSGVNRFTVDYRNYYDSIHCKPAVGEEIFKEIYKH